MAKLKSLKVGQRLWTVSRGRMGNTTISTINVHTAKVMELRDDAALISWNGNPPTWTREEDCNDWVKANVLPHLGNLPRLPLGDIAILVREWVDLQCEDGDPPEFWGYYADYDWVVTAQMFGTMMDLPKGWPMYCRDIKQLCDSLGNPTLPKQDSTEHNALADAKWNKVPYEFLTAEETTR